MLKYRILSALVLIPATVAALFLLSFNLFAYFMIFICMLAAWEWGQFTSFNQHKSRIFLGIATGILLYWLFTLSTQQASGTLLIYEPLVQVILLLGLGWWLAATGLVLTYPKSSIIWQHANLLRLLFGAFTLIPFFFAMITLRQFGSAIGQSGNIQQGAQYLLYIMLLVWGTDSGAYAFGKLFGKHKLVPSVSPGKTWEGVFGGLSCAIILMLIISRYLPVLPLATWQLWGCSIVAVLASILGDLSESMFKRRANIKDSSHLIPGHGGILDRIDSLTAALPVFVGLLMYCLVPNHF